MPVPNAQPSPPSADRRVGEPLSVAAAWRLDDWEWLDTGSLAAWVPPGPLGATLPERSLPPHQRNVPAEADDCSPPDAPAASPAAALPSRLALAGGLLAFACGGVLLAWALLAGRGDLWSWGLTLTLAGQTAVLLGLGVQLEGLWYQQRLTTQRLTELAQSLSAARRRGPASR